ncbi:hypothetical protein POF50_020115 [Streptomyces sp. SL13]|uniref:Uncharacterized protein n=1 Tax=Streptantibioticus silvisoli TaxID=2705255 RepID=A0AA90KHM8_9ACTN|nr:hypothetical protein [Streptantibioticus silvisoli]MDI5966267.1 hypothetical protein [Streptantibioticus silvisoli]MDI5971609.1 hypothetical protein [Streptantibioticus silvisoli]
MTSRDRRGQRVAVVAAGVVAALAVALGVLCLGIAPAYAKSDIYFAAGPHNARLGRPVHLSGSAVDDNATFNKFCIQRRYGHGGWNTVRCAHGSYNGGGGLNVWLRPERRGLVLFRGVLLEGRSAADKHPRIHLVSRVFALAVL